MARFQTDYCDYCPILFPKPSSPWRQMHSTSFFWDSGTRIDASSLYRFRVFLGCLNRPYGWRSWDTNSYRIPNLVGEKRAVFLPTNRKNSTSAGFLARFKPSMTWFTTSMCSSWELRRVSRWAREPRRPSISSQERPRRTGIVLVVVEVPNLHQPPSQVLYCQKYRIILLPSGSLIVWCGKPPCSIGKSSIKQVIYGHLCHRCHSYVKWLEGNERGSVASHWCHILRPPVRFHYGGTPRTARRTWVPNIWATRPIRKEMFTFTTDIFGEKLLCIYIYIYIYVYIYIYILGKKKNYSNVLPCMCVCVASLGKYYVSWLRHTEHPLRNVCVCACVAMVPSQAIWIHPQSWPPPSLRHMWSNAYPFTRKKLNHSWHSCEDAPSWLLHSQRFLSQFSHPVCEACSTPISLSALVSKKNIC